MTQRALSFRCWFSDRVYSGGPAHRPARMCTGQICLRGWTLCRRYVPVPVLVCVLLCETMLCSPELPERRLPVQFSDMDRYPFFWLLLRGCLCLSFCCTYAPDLFSVGLPFYDDYIKIRMYAFLQKQGFRPKFLKRNFFVLVFCSVFRHHRHHRGP